MKKHYLVNPVAGRGRRAVEIIERIKEECAKREDSSLYITKNSSDAEKYCREISALPGEHRFIVCGGDGTIGEALNGIAGRENASLAVIPIGTGNDFVRNFCKNDSDRDLFFDLDAQNEGEEVLSDYLEVTVNGIDKKMSVNMLNAGFDCEIADKVNEMRSNKLVPPKFAYVAALIQKFAKKPTIRAKIEVDGETFEMDERILIAIGNGGYCGGGFNAASKAELSDGLTDICIVKNVTRMDILRLIGSYKAGTHLENEKILPFFTYRKCKNIKMTFEKPQKVCFDGEIDVCETLDINNINRGFRLVLPKGIDTGAFYKEITEAEEEKEALTV
ncbi:MAG: hypothetical protein J6D45_01565 [Clostridia bacterium]|nr:hypothetical protein [Clostridia bacterium]